MGHHMDLFADCYLPVASCYLCCMAMVPGEAYDKQAADEDLRLQERSL